MSAPYRWHLAIDRLPWRSAAENMRFNNRSGGSSRGLNTMRPDADPPSITNLDGDKFPFKTWVTGVALFLAGILMLITDTKGILGFPPLLYHILVPVGGCLVFGVITREAFKASRHAHPTQPKAP